MEKTVIVQELVDLFSCTKPTRDISTRSIVSYKTISTKRFTEEKGGHRWHWKLQDVMSFWMLLYVLPYKDNDLLQLLA